MSSGVWQAAARVRPGLAIASGGLAAGLFDLLGAIAVYRPSPPAG